MNDITAPRAEKRELLLLVGDTVDDRRVIAAVLSEPSGSVHTVVIPSPVRPTGLNLKLGQSLLVLATSVDRRHMVPIRFATLAGMESTEAVVTLSLELDGRPSMRMQGLVQAFVEARGINPDRGRLHRDGPPLVEAARGEDPWLEAVERLSNLDPDAYRDTVFLTVQEPVGSDLINARLFAPAVEDARLADLVVLASDVEGAILFEQPGASSLSMPSTADAVRLAIRHERLSGSVHLPERAEEIATLLPVSERAIEPLVQHDPTSPNLKPVESVSIYPTRFEAYALLQLLEVQASLPPAVIADAAHRLCEAAPEDVRIPTRESRALLESGRPDQAISVLRAIPDRLRPGDAEALMLVAELMIGSYEVALDRYGRAHFDAWTFEQLVDAIAKLPPAPAATVTESLMMVLSETRASALVSRVGPGLPAGASLIAIAGRIAAVSPSDAVDLLKRSGEITDLPTDLIDRLYRLQVENDDTDIAPAAIELVRRMCGSGRVSDAVGIADDVRHRLHWRDAQALADVLLDALVKGTPEWSDERLIQAMTTVALMQDAIRGLKDVDLSEALETAARLRQALEPVPSDIDGPLTGVEEELFTAFQSTEAHRAALEELSAAGLADLRTRYNGKRLFIVGGRRPDWWDDLVLDLALDRNSVWREVEPGRRPSMEWLKAKVSGGKIDLLVVVTEYIAHATSAIADFAEDRHLRTVKARAGRYSMLTCLRTATDKK